MLYFGKGSFSEVVANIRDGEFFLNPLDANRLDRFEDSCVERTNATNTIAYHLQLQANLCDYLY